ncbi:MAG TPA: TetR/AcrR family transcriptional regulator [Gaiellaceae bacterium]|jgi:AcrR family transcriptional regulator|nr:TetR/AcrR family transcriptional regulator [Gaiellaceae bacterium]
MMVVTTERKSKEERREDILDAAIAEFAAKGLHGASTDEIARLAGISQPYVFRLFGTKKELYLAVIARCFRQTLEVFQRVAEGKRGEEALHAIGEAYGQLLESDRVYLRAQMQAYAACEDPEICAVVRAGFGDLVTYVERVSGVGSEELAMFFSGGMLMNVLSSMDASVEDWGLRLVEGCKKPE